MAVRFEAGQCIGKFRLEEELPSGGLSTLWRVSASDLTFPAILKMPLMRPGENPLTIVGFETETTILPRLSGPHVPRFVGAGDFERPYVIMELVSGTSVKSFLKTLPLDYLGVAGVGAQIASALHDIHRQNVIHLDVKPSNVILRGEDAVLIDFGFARHLHLPDLLAEEFDGPIGTGPYISPEQLDGIRHDPRSDLFALGVILYFLATGERPFGDPETMREWHQRLYYDPKPPVARRPDFPPWLQEVVLRCLEIDPAARYQTAAQVAFELQHPDQVLLTSRATRRKPRGTMTAVRRWMDRRRLGPHYEGAPHRIKAPILMAAVDLGASAELNESVFTTVRQALLTEVGARLACVNVMTLSRFRLDDFEDPEGRNIHLQRLAELKHWTHRLPGAQITYHVVESVDPATALIEFARKNHVDHIIMGARSSSAFRRFLGSVSARVVAEAECTVTVVRMGSHRSATKTFDARSGVQPDQDDSPSQRTIS
jgi:nucleotide-binding universal stress UspA family protein